MIEHPKLNNGVLRYEHLLGKEFIHGVQDCYTIPQRMFMDNLNIKLRDYARPNDWWLKEGMSLYTDNFHKEGFRSIEINQVSELHILDCFLVAIPDPRSPAKTVANHCAVYVGDGKIVHHRYGKLSQEVPYRGMMKNFTVDVLRHKDVPDLIDRTRKTLDVMDYILPHKKELLMRSMKDGQNS